jgi:hypothetical protein
MSHGCVECTHIKRYRSDLINEGVVLGADLDDVAGIAASANDNNVGSFAIYTLYVLIFIFQAPELAADDAVDQLGSPQQQAAPQAGTPRGYICLAVMDGKTIQHRVRFFRYISLQTFIMPVYRNAHYICVKARW